MPGQGGQPNASFQVLVEPDGTTGSYILFDKTTLQPIAIVNQAGQQVNINNGIINITTNPLTPELQKLITDVFQQKFTDNTNTKSTSPSTDSIIPTSQPLIIKLAEIIATTTTVNLTGSGATQAASTPSESTHHIAGAPTVYIANILGVATTSFLISELPGQTGSPLPDASAGIVTFGDINVGDQPSVSAAFSSFSYKNAKGQDVTASLSPLQLADIAATEIQLTVIPGANNTNNGTALFTYSIADKSFDFLAAGEQLTLTYVITVNDNYAPDPESRLVPITITITGSNDAPVITTSPQSITFTPAGTKTVGGDLQTPNPTSGTLTFTDVDLTDTHTVSAKLTGVVMSNGGTLPPLPEGVFENALTASILPGNDSTGTGAGTINWQLAPLQTYLADFIPSGATVTLTYTVTVTDSQGATATQTITVVVPGDNNPAVVWIHTTTDGHDNLWSDKLNWSTGTVPAAGDAVIISTDQLHPDTPAYPATIDGTTAAVANSVTMNDHVNLPPELDVANGGSLAIGEALTLYSDSILKNAGTITVSGAIELINTVDDNGNPVLNQSVVTNSGTLNLEQGGDFQAQAHITNTGTIDLQGGVLNVLVDIANAGGEVGGQITVEQGATLKLGHDAGNSPTVNGGITGGTLTVEGELVLEGSNFVKDGALVNSGVVDITGLGNSLDGETIANSGTIELKSGAALTIDQGSSVTGSG
ncbi:MAG: VCBS domain-containing protein, partial [Bradyrhizobium sp.]|nr:VCBS domain-containing protein [Bradyrhizobium sp.]